MTYEEAIELLNNIKLTYVCDPQDCGLEKDSSTCKAMHCEEYHYALSMAIEALEKMEQRCGNCVHHNNYTYWCDERVIGTDNDMYCTDWSEEE